jgi:NADH-quinone oxidoreductase subunit M
MDASFPWLSLVLWLPTVGAALVLALPAQAHLAIRRVTLAVTLLTFAFSIPLFTLFRNGLAGMQFEERRDWIPAFGISYHLGIDGISLLLVLLTTLLLPICVLASWTYITKRVKEFHILLLVLATGMIGVFAALDMFVFYVFWELMLIPMYFLIGIWGGRERVYASVKFFLYTFVGSLLMLVAILVFFFQYRALTGTVSYDLLDWYGVTLPAAAQALLFLAFFLAFAIKVPMFPFHTWLPDAHVQAPTAGSVILAAVLLKMGTYGFVRFAMPLFPDATLRFLPWLLALSVVAIVYGAMVATVQPNVKKLVAYSSVSHLGFVTLGLFVLNAQGLQGGVLQMVNHGLSTGALFLLVGMLYERRHTYEIADFGGLARPMPVFATLFMIVTLSSIGLPGLNGFVGEFLVLIGAFRAHPGYAVPATAGVILAAVYMLWMYQRVMFNGLTREENRDVPDLDRRELAILLPIAILIVWLGVYPKPFLDKIEPAVQTLVERMESAPGFAEAPSPTPAVLASPERR